MSYATLQNMIDRVGRAELVQLTDRESRPPAAINEQIVQQALEDADGEINGYLQSAGVVTPMVSPPSVLIAKAADIARYRLHKDKATDKVRTDYEDARSWLRDVAAGRVFLGDKSSPAKAPSLGPVKMTGSKPIFTKNGMDGL